MLFNRLVAASTACIQATAAVCLASSIAWADDAAVAEFYKGKTLRIIVGYGPGGGYDLYSRILARHMPKHIPGNPGIVVVNREGAGSLAAANALYTTEPKDGTVFGTVSEGLPLLQRMGVKGVMFDATKFNWIGSAVQTTYACAARASLDVSLDKLIAGQSLIMASSSPGSSPYDVPAVLREALSLNLRLVTGYRNTPVLIKSIETKETDGLCSTLSTLIEPAGRALLGGEAPLGKLFLVFAQHLPAAQASHEWVKGAPSVETHVATAASKALITAFDMPARIHKPFVAPPGVPKERIVALEKAFMQSFSEPEFKAEVEKSALVASPVSGDDTTKLVKEILEIPPAVVSVLERILQ